MPRLFELRLHVRQAALCLDGQTSSMVLLAEPGMIEGSVTARSTCGEYHDSQGIRGESGAQHAFGHTKPLPVRHFIGVLRQSSRQGYGTLLIGT